MVGDGVPAPWPLPGVECQGPPKGISARAFQAPPPQASKTPPPQAGAQTELAMHAVWPMADVPVKAPPLPKPPPPQLGLGEPVMSLRHLRERAGQLGIIQAADSLSSCASDDSVVSAFVEQVKHDLQTRMHFKVFKELGRGGCGVAILIEGRSVVSSAPPPRGIF